MSIFNKENLEKFIFDTLLSSGEIALKYFRNNNIVSDSKEDGTIVTQADKEIEAFIRDRVSINFSDVSIIGEEFDEVNGDSEYCFVIDPIDGTNAFASGKPTFGVMIAVIFKDKAILSGIYQPYNEELWLANGAELKFYKNGKLNACDKVSKKNTINIATTSTYLFDDRGNEIFELLKKESSSVTLGGDCYNYCLLANGHIDIVYEQGLKPYDYIPLIPIVEASGGVICDINGDSISCKSKIEDDLFAFSSENLKNKVFKEILQID